MTETEVPEETTSITKSARRGRRRYSAEYKQEVLDAFEASALSGPEFARHCGVRYPTFAGWVAKRRKGRERGAEEGGGRGQRFVLAEFSDPAAAGGGPGRLIVSLPGGASAEVADAAGAELLARLLKSLA